MSTWWWCQLEPSRWLRRVQEDPLGAWEVSPIQTSCANAQEHGWDASTMRHTVTSNAKYTTYDRYGEGHVPTCAIVRSPTLH